MPSDTSLLKDEPQSRTESEVGGNDAKLESPTLDVREELSEPEASEQNPDALREEVQENRESPPQDSEDSLSPERVAELRRLTETQVQATSATPYQGSEEGATAPNSAWNWEGATAPDSTWDWENRGPYAPQRSGRYRGRLQSPDPSMFRSTIWVSHDPVDQLRDRVCAMEHNLETLRTRLLRLESMLSGERGGVIGETIRACNRRIDSDRATMDDFYARISTQDWYRDLSDQEGTEEVRLSSRDTNAENQPGMENGPSGRRRIRGHAPQRRFQRTMPRPPPPPAHDTEETATFPPEMIQQATHRLFVAYNQCVNRVAQTDDRLEPFRSAIRRDALDIALTVQKTIEQIKSTLFEDVQERVKSLEERLRSVMDHEEHVTKTIDKNTHSQCASISALIDEQADIRKLVEGLANRLDQSQATSNTPQSEISTNVLLEIGDLKTKVLRLTEQSTKHDGDLSFLIRLSEQVDLIEDQIRLPELTEDESKERVVSAVEVREELDDQSQYSSRKCSTDRKRPRGVLGSN